MSSPTENYQKIALDAKPGAGIPSYAFVEIQKGARIERPYTISSHILISEGVTYDDELV